MPINQNAEQQSASGQAYKVNFVTFGCKVNEFESQMLAEKLQQQDCLLSERDQADVFIINTCTVTREADRQARQEIRRIVRDHPASKVIVTGCYAQMNAEQILAIDGVDLVVGNDRKMDLPQMLDEVMTQASNEARIIVGDVDEHVSLPEGILSDFEGRTRAFLQIQQGCNQGCTFCIIHKARGKSRSFKPEAVIQQVQRLIDIGFKEIVICGVDLGSYAEDFDDGEQNLSQLLRRLIALPGEFRLRLSSIDPSHINDELIALFAEDKICSHLHLSLQSGSDLILKRMKRRYTSAHVFGVIARLRKAAPNLVISADIMAGFPTEEDEHFADSLAIIEQLQIAYPHVFAYSEREGTPAARIPRQVDVAVRKQRAKELRDCGEVIRSKVFEQYIGQEMQVLVENKAVEGGAYLIARADNYLPIAVPADQYQANTLAWVTPRQIKEDYLIADS